MKMLAAKKLCLVGVVFLAVFALSYATAKGADNTKSLKKHTDFLNKYVIYDLDEDDGYWVYFDSPTTLQWQDYNGNPIYNGYYGFDDLGGQNFLITFVDENGNTTSQILNAKKSTAITHSVAKNAKTPTAKQAKVSVTTNKTVAAQASSSSTTATASSKK